MTAKYKVTWEELSLHSRELTAEELAKCIGIEASAIDADSIDDYTEELADGLAKLDNDGFECLYRREIEVTPIPDGKS